MRLHGVLLIRDIIPNSQPFQQISCFSHLEVTSSVENLFQYMQLEDSVDFVVFSFGLLEDSKKIDAWIRTLRAIHPEIRVLIILDTAQSTLPDSITEYVDHCFDRKWGVVDIPDYLSTQFKERFHS